MKQNEERRWNKLLDHALAAYTSHSPPLGLDARVLRQVRAEGVRPGWRWPLVAAAACLLVGSVVWIRRDPIPSPAIGLTNATPRPGVARDMGRSRPPGKMIPRRREGLPQRVVSPIQASSTPSALTQEERALLAFASRAPDEALLTFGQMQPIEIEPLSIDKIEVQPLPDHPSQE